jgi:hypothetical protein
MTVDVVAETLCVQGHDIAAIAIMTPSLSSASDTPAVIPRLDNDDVIAKHISVSPGSTPPKIFRLPQLGPKLAAAETSNSDAASGIDAALQQWLSDATKPLSDMHAHLREWHDRRSARLLAAPTAARNVIWWPFTQHKGMTDGSITVIDARVGERYSVVKGHRGSSNNGSADLPESSESFETSVHDLSVVQEYDGCASWWTQGVAHVSVQHGIQAIAALAQRMPIVHWTWIPLQTHKNQCCWLLCHLSGSYRGDSEVGVSQWTCIFNECVIKSSALSNFFTNLESQNR